MKKIIYVVAIAILTLTACKNTKKTGNHSSDKKVMEKNDGHNHEHSKMEKKAIHKETEITQNNTKNAATTPIINAYLEIKNGLVASDKVAAAKGGTALLAAFKGFDMSKLTGDTHKEYMEILENAKEQAEHIIKSPIDHQREHFTTLSTDINDLIALLGTEKTLYLDYCSMVKASWLSETKEIKNPFYGDKMLTCGSVKKQIN